MAASIHDQNLQKLAVEMFKVSREVPKMLMNYFNLESKYLMN